MRTAMTAIFTSIALFAVGCGSDVSVPNELTGAAATIHSDDCVEPTGDTITIYSGRSEELVGPVLEAFECASGVATATNYGDPTDLALTLAEEGERTPADLFLSKSPGAVGFLRNTGLLAELDDSVLELVDSNNRASDGRWVGITGRQRVLVYNVDEVAAADLPASVFDLTDEAYRGQVAIPAGNGSFLDWFTMFRAANGDDVALGWLRDMAANDAIVTESNRPTVDAVGRGEIRFGLVNHYYNFQEAEALGADHRAENHVFPADDVGSLVIVTAGGVTTSSENADAATELLRFMLDEGAQTYFTDETLEYPLAGDVEPASVLPPLETSSAFFDIEFDALGNGLERTLELVEQSGINR